MAGEFDLIKRFFTHEPFGRWRSQGVGDDCALIDTAGEHLSVTMDQMAVGTHFLPDALPENVGYKALAVNLSDLAASGAEPRCFFLGLALPEENIPWLEGFSKGLMDLARAHDCALLGGDMTRTPLVGYRHAPVTISITAMGAVPENLSRTRSGAVPGDDVWVSGTLGDAYAALMIRQDNWAGHIQDQDYLFSRMDRPEPRVALGLALRGIATACADVSDGLLADLGHILERSNISADIDWESVPLSNALQAYPVAWQQKAALTGGDDYELVFTASPEERVRIEAVSRALSLRLSRIGVISSPRSGDNLNVRDVRGRPIFFQGGFDHFAADS